MSFEEEDGTVLDYPFITRLSKRITHLTTGYRELRLFFCDHLRPSKVYFRERQ
jgi:hypothetical protein